MLSTTWNVHIYGMKGHVDISIKKSIRNNLYGENSDCCPNNI